MISFLVKLTPSEDTVLCQTFLLTTVLFISFKKWGRKVTQY